MSKILYAWEMGAGYGHIAPFLPVATELKKRGHEVVFSLKDLGHADTLLGKDGFVYMQAPMRWPDGKTMPPAVSYPGILRNAGFDDGSGLLARVNAWRALYRYLKPDLILFDHAPTALLGARGFDTPKALFGTGFYSPPRVTPLPKLHPWLSIAEKDLIKIESQILETINAVSENLACEPLANLAELFDVDEDFLCTFAEFDHYSNRDGAVYWGPSLYRTEGVAAQWPSVGSNKVFAYLNRDYPGLETLLQQLRSSSWSVLVHIAGISPAFAQKHSAPNLHISLRALNFSEVSDQCDMAISYAGAGTIAVFLMAGKPMLLMPFHMEQLINARNVAALGAGICVAAETKKPNYRNLVSEILTKPKYAEAAANFAKKYAEFPPERQAENIATRCESLMNG